MAADRKESTSDLGWKVWHSDGTNITVYSSKTHNWTELPSSGIQYMYRYYQSGTTSWREMIAGQDIYTETNNTLDSLTDTSTEAKRGETVNFDLIREAEAAAVADTTWAVSIDNSLEKYSSTKKQLLGWKVWTNANGGLKTYVSTSSEWTSIPTNEHILVMYRVFKEGRNQWKELVRRQGLYFETTDKEVSVILVSDTAKRGSIISEPLLMQIYNLVYTDTETF